MNEIQWQVFATIVSQVETPLMEAVAKVMTAFLSFVAAPLKVALVLYIALSGILVLRGEANAAGSTLLGRFLKMGLVVYVLTGAGTYQHLVHDFFFTTLPTGLAQALTASGSGTITANSFDTVWIKAFHAGLEVWRTLGWRDIVEKAVIVLFWAVSIVSTVVAFAIWLVSRLILALYIALGPLIVGLVLFPTTRSIFERWIGALVSCVILQVTTIVLLTIILAVEQKVVEQVALLGATDTLAMIQVLFAGVIFFLVAAFVAFQLPGVASSLAGGLHFHAGTVARAAQTALGAFRQRRQGNDERQGDDAGRNRWIAAGQAANGRAAQTIATTGRSLGRRLRPATGASLSDGG